LTIDLTLSLGTIVNVVVLLAALFGIFRRFSTLETKVDLMWRWFRRNIVSINGRDVNNDDEP
jgi:hypothetical protein